jgi:superfamily II DNA or RNA helicase
LNDELLTQLRTEIPSATRAKGEVYARLGRAEVQSSGPDHAIGRVRGSALYRVRAMLDPRTHLVEANCECGAFREFGPCKHVWALALAASGAGRARAGFGGTGAEVALRGDTLRGDTLRGDTLREWQLALHDFDAAAAGSKAAPPPVALRWILDLPSAALGGEAVLFVGIVTARKRGGWNKLRGLSAVDLGNRASWSAQDREWLDLVLGAVDQFATPFAQEVGVARLRDAQAARLLPEIARAGRLEAREREDAPPFALEWEDGEPWRAGLALVRDGAALELRARLRRGDEALRPEQAAALFARELIVHERRLGRVDARGAWTLLRALRGGRRFAAPARDERAVSIWLVAEHGAALDALPQAPRAEGIEPHPYLRLDAPEAGAASIAVQLAFAYDGFRVRALDPRELVWEPGDTRLLPRDRAAEARLLEEFRAAGGDPTASPETDRDGAVPLARLASLVHALGARGWLIDAAGKRLRAPGQAKFTLSSGIDWLELEGGVDYEGAQATLPALLEAARSGSGLVRLSDGSLGLLPEQWLSSWGLFDALGEQSGDKLRFRASQALLLETIARVERAIEADARLTEVAERVRSFDGLVAAQEPAGFRGKLRPYQRDGLAWLHALGRIGFGGCLADDMGLGKTVQVLALLASRASHKPRRTSLVVAPKSLVFNWQREAERFTPSLDVLVHAGAERRRDAREFGKHDLVLTTYGTLRQDIGMLREVPFDCVVLDEAQAIKTAGSQTARAARLLSGEQRLALSGTPIENHLGELWSLMEFLNPGLLGRSRAFASLVESSDGLSLAEHDRALLRRALAPLVLRRTKAAVLPELPERSEQDLRCELEGAQARDYKKVLDYCRATVLGEVEEHGLARSKLRVLEALLRLRQAACHPGLLDRARAGETSAKLDLVLPLLADVAEEGHKALVYSQFTSFLDIVEERLKALGLAYERLDGQTEDREARVARFQGDASVKVFLLSLKAGGVGLNLTAASYVFLLDPWWNPAAEAQAIDRAHRIGQQQKVMAYRVVATGTIEEKVLELQAKKRALFDALFGPLGQGAGEAVGPLKGMTKRELEWLLT